MGFGQEAWEAKLAALRSYRRASGHLAPRQDAVWGEGDAMVPIGQHIANLRRKGTKNGLGKDPERAAVRAAQLTKIDPDWNCPWPLDWQRHYKVLADLADTEGEGVLSLIEPGVQFDGDDLGLWLERMRHPNTWAHLSTEQQERLTALGMQPPASPSPAQAAGSTAKGTSRAQQAFQRGLAALTQWVGREGANRPVPRGHGEPITVDGEAEPVIIRLGVWISNTKQRRSKLTADQLASLAALGVDWASTGSDGHRQGPSSVAMVRGEVRDARAGW
ncbi:Helicase associated domain protein [Streptomyces sp. NPDC008317]|uniref:helicase associated domain-containing protein n=1 Tax=Streptomyces sp. NPDC008317 TaxID=3364827 RepID=UPI0036ED89C4